MARNVPFSEFSYEIDYPASLACPMEWMRAEKAIIRLSILDRDPSIGASNLSQFIPRTWTGYYYLLKANAVRKHGAIEFKNQEVYNDKHFWTAEMSTQTYVNELSTIDADGNELIDEGSTVLALTNILSLAKILPFDIPILDNFATFINDNLANIASDDIYYYPQPDRPDRIAISIPDGFATIKIEFLWIPYSPLLVAGGILEPSIDEEIELNSFPLMSEIETETPSKTFDERAIEKGYIPPNALGSACLAAGYVSAAELDSQTKTQLKDIVQNTIADPSIILGNLIQNGAISQSDIDSQRALFPNILDRDIIKNLIDNGTITSSELLAIVDGSVSSTILPPAGKKSATILIRTQLSQTGCTTIYTATAYFYTSTGQVSSVGVGQSSANNFSAANLNWSLIPMGGSYNLKISIGARIFPDFQTNCGGQNYPLQRWLGTIAGASTGWADLAAPTVFFAIQP